MIYIEPSTGDMWLDVDNFHCQGPHTFLKEEIQHRSCSDEVQQQPVEFVIQQRPGQINGAVLHPQHNPLLTRSKGLLRVVPGGQLDTKG